jgi:hypothetical protein
MSEAQITRVFLGLTNQVGVERALSATEIMLLANLMPDEAEAKTVLEARRTGLEVEHLSEVHSIQCCSAPR